MSIQNGPEIPGECTLPRFVMLSAAATAVHLAIENIGTGIHA